MSALASQGLHQAHAAPSHVALALAGLLSRREGTQWRNGLCFLSFCPQMSH